MDEEALRNFTLRKNIMFRRSGQTYIRICICTCPISYMTRFISLDGQEALNGIHSCVQRFFYIFLHTFFILFYQQNSNETQYLPDKVWQKPPKVFSWQSCRLSPFLCRSVSNKIQLKTKIFLALRVRLLPIFEDSRQG